MKRRVVEASVFVLVALFVVLGERPFHAKESLCSRSPENGRWGFFKIFQPISVASSDIFHCE